MKRDYRGWNNPKIAFAGLGIVLLLLLAVYVTDSGSHRWLRAGPVFAAAVGAGKTGSGALPGVLSLPPTGRREREVHARPHRDFDFDHGAGRRRRRSGNRRRVGNDDSSSDLCRGR